MQEILSTASSGEGLYIVFFFMVSPGDEFILPNPTFPTYASLLRLHGGVAKYVPTKVNFHLDIDAIREALTSKTKAIVLCNPNNPTGAVYEEGELREVFNIAEQHDLTVISDENYSQVTYDGKTHFSIASFPGALDRVIIVNGLSKVYAMTGWRLGYIIARKEFIEQFEKIAYEIRGSVNTAVQYAGAKALHAPEIVVQRIVKEYNNSRKLVVDSLRKIGFNCHLPEGGFEVFPSIPPPFDNSKKFAEYLVKTSGVLVKPGVYFGPDGESNFRLVYCKERKILREAMSRIAAASKDNFGYRQKIS